ncbi:MAG: hypothetical protein UV63_C0010G0007 [Microgenomates group bacterium GW2011_GWC1_43_11]|uniref:Uncharacterized protein n=2 Tax=Candidatus Gottesmaniibacteriota TaxID=1752720 RepID=A0A0G1KVI5_9BACT|nr:MAG: hypothetical protein UV63_C0010G0007 [Microgenomates group bacterium GW2011_GWC1_43_11]KKT37793.1 MAG: hypothetical protein UW22_C0018G0018 [Candidatus Gottesmanbacteria bacterium GW2011_GWB1_44_11c]KKT60347.1 MAG: hypothetical protein UW52_C0027G0019 [Candidatus Gottesmanbacteria bacterium GW2011_GWA1_44_24b]HCM82328.1 hypothetical protein [Patescibacteria group bacterium]
MDYYRDTVTDKSWQTLQALRHEYDFVLIGGWAVWLYTHQLKSKDIDIIVSMESLVKIKEKFTVTKNNRLSKYEAIVDEIQIDIYVPFWSKLGLPAEDIMALSHNIGGFRVPQPEILVILKQIAYGARSGSSKGYKDMLDIMSLLRLPEFDWRLYCIHAKKTKKELISSLSDIISHTTQLPELNLNAHHFSKLKKEWLNALKK